MRTAKLVLLFLLLSIPAASAAPLVGRGFAVVSTSQVFQECSGAGGEHYVFQIDGDTRLAHAGGHAQYLRLLPQRIALAGTAPVQPAAWFVAELVMAAPVSEDADGNPDSSRDGWCLDRLPRFSGSVLRLVPAKDRDAAVAMLPALVAHGLPRATFTLAAATKESFAVARITRHTEVTGGRRFAIEAVDGDAPPSFDVPSTQFVDLWTGDLVVVATTGSGATRRVTRGLAADDLAGARQWLDTARGGTWPPDWIVPGHAGAFGTARWAAFGKVVKGKRGCGLEVKITTHSGTSYVLDPMRVAAPAGAKRGDLLAAVVMPTYPAGKDRCGRTARVVRAYPAPAGATGASWLIGGEVAPSPALVE